MTGVQTCALPICAAAHKAKPGDLVIIATYAQMDEEEAENFKPSVVLLGDNNEIKEQREFEYIAGGLTKSR